MVIMDFDVKLKVDVDWIEVGLTWYELDGVNVKLNVKICSDAWRSCCIFGWRYDVGFGYEAMWKGKKRRRMNRDEKGKKVEKKSERKVSFLRGATSTTFSQQIIGG